MASSSTALKTFNLANDVYTITPQDELYKFEPDTHKRILRDAPWAKEYASAVIPLVVPL